MPTDDHFLTVRLPRDDFERFRELAEEDDRPVSALARLLIRQAIRDADAERSAA